MPTTEEPFNYFYITPEISVVLAILEILLLIVLIVYLYVLINLEYIKNNWDAHKCGYGLVLGGYDNLVECAQKALKNTVEKATKPLYNGANMIHNFYIELENQVTSVLGVLGYIKNQITELFTSIAAMIAKILLPIQMTLTAVMTIFSKVKAIMVSQLYFIVASVITMKSFIAAMINAIIMVLVALAALIITMMIIPFGWGVAASFIAIFVSISIPLAAFVVVMSKVTRLNILKIPKVPKLKKPHILKKIHICFDKDTQLTLTNGTSVAIQNIQIGNVLYDGSIITATMILGFEKTRMFYLNNVLVTGTHIVQYNNTWIPVEDHPDSIHLPDYSQPYVYCVNTDTGILRIGSNVFTDWNEMMVDDFITHSAHSLIELKDDVVFISQCKVGDVLMDTRIITGIVTTKGNIDEPGYRYHIYYN
jgi:hypothetical protein